MDSVSIDPDGLKKYNPKDIASVSVYKDSTAIGLIGPDGKDGILFRSISPDYAKAAPTPESDTLIQYVLNKSPLTENFEGKLASINDSTIKEIKVIDKSALQKDYAIFNKSYGVIITTIPDKNSAK